MSRRSRLIGVVIIILVATAAAAGTGGGSPPNVITTILRCPAHITHEPAPAPVEIVLPDAARPATISTSGPIRTTKRGTCFHVRNLEVLLAGGAVVRVHGIPMTLTRDRRNHRTIIAINRF